MPTSRQYKLYASKTARIIVFTAPVFREDQYLDYNWEEPAVGDIITIWDPMEPPTEEPESLEPIEGEGAEQGFGSPETIREDVLEGTVALRHTNPQHAETLGESGHSKGPDSDAESDTIVVDMGDQSPKGTASTALAELVKGTRSNERIRSQNRAYRAQEQIKIPKSKAEALADPLWAEAIKEELIKLQALKI